MTRRLRSVSLKINEIRKSVRSAVCAIPNENDMAQYFHLYNRFKQKPAGYVKDF